MEKKNRLEVSKCCFHVWIAVSVLDCYNLIISQLQCSPRYSITTQTHIVCVCIYLV